MSNSVTLKYLLLAENQASKVLKQTGTDVEKTGQKVSGFGKTTKLALAGAGIAAVGFASSAISKFKQVTTESRGLQRAMGGTLEEASRMREAAILSGVDYGTFSKSISKLDKTLVGATANQKTAAAMTKALGISFQDASGHVKPMGELLPQISDRFAKMPDGPEKSALAMKLFGKAGMSMLPFLDKGASGIAALEKQSDKFGTTLNGGAIEALAKSREQSRLFQAGLDGLKVQLGAQLLPIMNKLFGFIEQYVIPVIQHVTAFLKDNKQAMTFLGIVIGTVVVGLKLWAIAQGILNTVMAANPIALVVIAIAALAAGLVYAYKHSDTFRRIVQTAFAVVKTYAEIMWNALKTIFQALVSAWHFVGHWFSVIGGDVASVFGFVKRHWDLILAPMTGGMSILIRHWRAVRDAFVAVWHFIRDNVFGPIVTVFHWVWDQISTIAGWIMKTIHAILGPIGTAIDAVKSAIGWLTGGGDTSPQAKRAGKAAGYQGGTPHRAAGGPVIARHPYIVGEHRPELFVPEHSGHILPKVPTGHGGTTVHITFPSGVILGSPAEVGRAVAKSLEYAARQGVRMHIKNAVVT